MRTLFLSLLLREFSYYLLAFLLKIDATILKTLKINVFLKLGWLTNTKKDAEGSVIIDSLSII
jgi:hypothetical protein